MPFYESAGIPAPETAWFRTREEAVNLDRRTVLLTLCPACGLVRSVTSGGTAAPADPHELLRPDPAAALLVCRHEFEHITRPPEFLRRVRGLVGADPAARMVMHLDNALHALSEGAFWIACREARTHFTPGSLARVVRASRFEVTELRRAEGDRRFVLTASPAVGATPMRFDLEDDLAAIAEVANGFATAACRQASRWRRIIDDFRADGQRLALWGADAGAVAFLCALQVSDTDVTAVVDASAAAQGMYLAGSGQRIIPPSALAQHQPDALILLDPRRQQEVRTQLESLQLRAPMLCP